MKLKISSPEICGGSKLNCSYIRSSCNKRRIISKYCDVYNTLHVIDDGRQILFLCALLPSLRCLSVM